MRADPPGSDPYGLLVSTDGQRTWTPNIALSYPIFAGVDGLSISPAFNTNGTVVASGQCTNTLYRSSDGGARWAPWAPWAPPIAFTAESNGQRDVVMMDMDSRAQRPVTTAAANDENPAWSPAWAEQMLVRGRRLLAEQAGLIRDEELRRAFCDNIAHHRRLTNMG